MTKVQWFMFFIRIGITAPIYWYLIYKVMELVGATELMWFLFWVYVPVSVALMILENATTKKLT